MPVIRIFVQDPDSPGEVARQALTRAEAAARRFEAGVEVRVVGLDEPEAADVGAAVEPTIAVDDLVLCIGQAPPAGHLVRALEAAIGGDA